ncbi:hypothetical protein ACFXKD_09155 [Nocardiopsis aegyptia]|uniref:hypothetical protein n=1 Tax=Nocardiopsis aegyptia TaxID=220378 RepID=UPI00366DA4E7
MPLPTRPPLSVRAQRVLLWIMAVLFFGNALWSMSIAGWGLFGIGYAMPYMLACAFTALLALKAGSARTWVWVCVIVLHAVILLFQLGRTLSADLYGLFGSLFSILGLALVLSSSSRRFFRGPQRGFAPYQAP